MRRSLPAPRVALALAAVSLAIGAATWSLARALRIDPPPIPSTSYGDSAATSGPIFAGITRAAVIEAVESDPFRPERRRPEVRFRLPGDEPTPTAPTTTPVAGELRLIGTVVAAEGGGFAMCQVGAEAPKVVRVGEKIGAYTLVNVHQGRARFRAADGEMLDVTVPKPGD